MRMGLLSRLTPNPHPKNKNKTNQQQQQQQQKATKQQTKSDELFDKNESHNFLIVFITSFATSHWF